MTLKILSREGTACLTLGFDNYSRLSDVKGRRRVFIVGSLLGAAAAIVTALPLAPGWISISLVLAIGVLIAIRSDVLALAIDFAGQREATTLGFVFVLMDGVGALGATLAGGCRRLSTSLCVSARRRILDHQYCSDFRRESRPSPCLTALILTIFPGRLSASTEPSIPI